MIVLENVVKEYPNGVGAINGISLHIERGEFVFVVGDSGSGKSTLIKLLLKELEPTSGTIRVNGVNLGRMKKRAIPKYRRKIGCVFQDFRLLKDRNVYENVAFAQRVVVTPIKEIKKNVPAMLSLVGLAEKYKSFPRQLSGGEQQRVALARALVNSPDILLADEPTGNLDPKTSREIMKLLEEINARGTTVLVVTHEETSDPYAEGNHYGRRERKRVHRMRFNTIGYCFKQGFKNIWRNKLFSLASMATMAACIFMFGIFFCMVQNFQHFVREAEEGVAVTVLFDEGTTEDEILEIGQ